jgi:radical SAM superfamily enzyme YgiQ (UPF0313 family)
MRVILALPPFPPTILTSYAEIMGWMGKKSAEPNLGIVTVAALLPREWQLQVVDLGFQSLSEADWAGAAAVFVTGMSIQAEQAAALIREAKDRGKIVVAGGPWVYHQGVTALQAGADLVLQGEAEGGMAAIIDRLASRPGGGILKVSERPDITRSPVPRWDLLDMGSYLSMPVQFSRGCPFQCEFCDVTYMFGRQVRTKTPEQVIGELSHLYDLGWRGEVAFVDDNFIGKPAKTKELLRRLIPWLASRGQPFEFQTQVSINLAQDRELLDLMVWAGFSKVCIGIESVETESLKSTGKYQNVGVDAVAACRTITRAGIRVKGACIIGFDQETTGVDRKIIDFATRTDIPDTVFNPLVAYPGTRLWARLEQEGRLLPDSGQNLGDPARLPNFVAARPLPDIAREMTNFFRTAYAPEFVLDRAFGQVAALGRDFPGKIARRPRPFEWRLILEVLVRQGWLAPSRQKFWKYVLLGLRRFPARLFYFFSYLAIAEHHFEFRDHVLREVAADLNRWQSQVPVASDQ